MKVCGCDLQTAQMAARAKWWVAVAVLLDGVAVCHGTGKKLSVEAGFEMGFGMAATADQTAEAAMSYIQRRLNSLRDDSANLRTELSQVVDWAKAVESRADDVENQAQRKDLELRSALEHEASEAGELRAERDREMALQESLRESEHETEELRNEVANLRKAPHGQIDAGTRALSLAFKQGKVDGKMTVPRMPTSQRNLRAVAGAVSAVAAADPSAGKAVWAMDVNPADLEDSDAEDGPSETEGPWRVD